MSNADLTPEARSLPGSAPTEPAPGRGRRRRIIAGVTAAVVVAGIAATGIGVAAATTPSESEASGQAAVSPEFHDDLRELRQAEPAEQWDLGQAIIDRAIDGQYGERAAAVAEEIDARLEALPDELEDDLRELVATPVDERRELGQQIRERAESGGYGAEVQQQIEELRGGVRPGLGGSFTSNT